MDVTAGSDPTADPTQQRLFGTAQLFLTDSRLVFAVLNSSRYVFLNRVFGVSLEQANVVTFLGGLAVADLLFEGGRRTARAPLRTSRADYALGGAVLRELAFAVGGPGSREVRGFATLVSGALLISVAFPGIRHTARRVREAESRARRARIARYSDMVRTGQ